MKKLKYEVLEEIAKQKTRSALANYVIPDILRNEGMAGKTWINDDVIFELYIPMERPEDAIVFCSTKLNAFTGDGETVVFDDKFIAYGKDK